MNQSSIIDSMVMSNIKYSLQRSGKASLGLGKRSMSYINPNIGGSWQEDMFGDTGIKPFEHEKLGGEYHEYDQSHWITGREFEEEVGLLTVYFNAFTTNCKPPVVLGYLGAPITRGFVRAMDEGIYSEHYGYNNSQGAFYKKFIQQTYFYSGEVTKKDGNGKSYKSGYTGQIKNSTRVVDAIGWEDLSRQKESIKRLGRSSGGTSGYSHDEDRVYAMIRKHLLGIEKNYYKRLSISDYVEKQAKDYMKKAVSEQIKKLTGKTVSKDMVSKAIMDKIVPTKLLNEIRGAGKAEMIITRGIKSKGIKAFGKAGRTAIMSDAAAGAASEAAVLAPELIPFIVAGVVIGKMVTNHASAKQASKAVAGTEGLDVLKVLAFKTLLKADIKKQIGYQGIDKMLMDKKFLFKNGGKEVYSNLRPKEMRSNILIAKDAWSKDMSPGFYRPGSSTKYETADQAKKGQEKSNLIMNNKKAKSRNKRIW